MNRALWALEINGLVERPQTYDFARIEGMGSTEQETTLMCISNPIGWGLISNAVWTGVPMRSLLSSAPARIRGLHSPGFSTGRMALCIHA